MSTKQSFEKMARNTWLAGLGSIEQSIEMLNKSIDTAQEKSNHLYHELLTRGEEIQNKLFETRDEVENKGKQLFGVNTDHKHEEQLAKLNDKVDALTEVVNKLLAEAGNKPVDKTVAPAEEVTNATAKPKTAVRRTTKTARTVKKAPSKATAKTTAKANPDKKNAVVAEK